MRIIDKIVVSDKEPSKYTAWFKNGEPIKAMSYVTDTLAEGWAAKDNIDWSIYEELLK